MLLALFLELNASKAEKVLMENVQDRLNTIRRQADGRSRGIQINTTLYRNIVKRMQAFGLIQMEIMSTRIIDNVFLQTSIYSDEIVNAFGDHAYVLNVARFNPALGELF